MSSGMPPLPSAWPDPGLTSGFDRRSRTARPREEICSHRAIDADNSAMSRARQIVAFGGGGFSMEAGNRLLDDYVLDATGVERPKVCFLPTASGDADHYIVRFYRHFPADVCEPSHVSLFRRDCGVADLRAHLLAQDLVYVGGGSVLSMLGAWRAHGLDVVLRDAWEAGVVMCGLSAGSLCWFAEGVSAFHGERASASHGLGLLPGLQRRALRRGAGAQRGLPGRDRRRAWCPATRPTTAPRCTSWAPSSRASSPRGRRRARTRRARGGRGGRAAAAVRVPRARAGRRLPPERRPRSRPSSPWAAAASRWSRRTRRSTSTCSRSRRAREPRICLLPTAGGDSDDQIRRFYAAFRDRRASRRTCRCSASAPARAAARAPARSGRHLRRRRVDGQPARALARPRARRDPARGLAGGRRAGRAQRRLDVLVPARDHESSASTRAAPRASASCPARTPCTTTASPSAGRSTSPPSPPARCPRATGSTTASGCCSAARGWRRPSPRGPARAPTASTRVDGGPRRARARAAGAGGAGARAARGGAA